MFVVPETHSITRLKSYQTHLLAFWKAKKVFIIFTDYGAFPRSTRAARSNTDTGREKKCKVLQTHEMKLEDKNILQIRLLSEKDIKTVTVPVILHVLKHNLIVTLKEEHKLHTDQGK